MILPIYLLGNPELRQSTKDITENSDELQSFIDDMLETMAVAKGIGLAAPQVGRLERLFVVDVSVLNEDHFDSGDTIPEQPMVFINATMLDESEEESDFEEGCLSIPDVHEDVTRSDAIRIQYLDRHFNERVEEYDGMLARVIQHEYDHVDGILFIDHITPFRRRILKRRLKDISDGNVEIDYPIYAHGRGVLLPGP